MESRASKRPMTCCDREAGMCLFSATFPSALNLGAREEHRKGRSGLVFGRGRTA